MDAVGAVVLKRHDDAARDDDTVYALLRVLGVTNDGARNLVLSAAGCYALAWISPPRLTRQGFELVCNKCVLDMLLHVLC